MSLCLCVLLFLSACQPTAATPTPEAPRVAAKQLATVYISPTPDEAERQATRFAAPPTSTVAPPTITPTATPYVGVFIGEAEPLSQDFPNFTSSFNTPIGGRLTPEAVTCAAAPAEEFGTRWRQNAVVAGRLGCAIQIMFAFNARTQVFERGVMYQREDTGEVWAIAPGGLGSGQYWYLEAVTPLANSDVSAPPGLRVPSGVLGGMWRTVPGVREALGYAQTAEQTVPMAQQRFESGSLLLDSEVGQVFALMVNGDAYGPY